MLFDCWAVEKEVSEIMLPRNLKNSTNLLQIAELIMSSVELFESYTKWWTRDLLTVEMNNLHLDESNFHFSSGSKKTSYIKYAFPYILDKEMLIFQ